MHKTNNRIYILSAPSYLDLVQYPHCTQIVTIKVQFQHYTFGPYAFHLASQCKSTRVFEYQNPKVNNYLEFNINQIMEMLGLLYRSWSCQQFLVARCLPKQTLRCHSLIPTMQCLMPNCSVAIKDGIVVRHSTFAHADKSIGDTRQH
jgi:hypothetical protein